LHFSEALENVIKKGGVVLKIQRILDNLIEFRERSSGRILYRRAGGYWRDAPSSIQGTNHYTTLLADPVGKGETEAKSSCWKRLSPD
jgi:hypothetical protein